MSFFTAAAPSLPAVPTALGSCPNTCCPQLARTHAAVSEWPASMFCAYLIYRLAYFKDFAAASKTLDITLGTVNTAVLICSSLTVALSIKAAQLGKKKMLVWLLLLTMVFGLAFLGIKGVEWTSKFKEHHVPGPTFHFEEPGEPGVTPQHAQIFFSLYFAMARCVV